MTNSETTFLDRWRAEEHLYGAWGNVVAARVRQEIDRSFDMHLAAAFLRIPPLPRCKTEDSLLQKAFHRQKGYANPYDDIEDKVGVRFVVLLDHEVRWIGKVLDQEKDIWRAVKARDHEQEIAKSPYEFGYQSLHYVVRSLGDQQYNGITIPDGLPCEVQVRTLLQHAYCEVTHDTLYKPAVQTTPQMKRAAAKSMALIEASGDYFTRLDQLISEQVAPLRGLNAELKSAYLELVGVPAEGENSPLNDLILDRYGREVELELVVQWLRGHRFVGRKVAARRSEQMIYRLPTVLLLYFLADTAPHGTRHESPVSEANLAQIYSDVGESLEG